MIKTLHVVNMTLALAKLDLARGLLTEANAVLHDRRLRKAITRLVDLSAECDQVLAPWRRPLPCPVVRKKR